MRQFSLVAIIFGLWACGNDTEDHGLPVQWSIETFNVALAGAFIPYEAERREAMGEALAALDRDVLCLQEVWEQSDKDRLITATAETFPYVASFTHNDMSSIHDGSDQMGNIPPAYEVPPCGENRADILQAALACVAENCSTIPGSQEGRTISTDCAVSNCLEQVVPLLSGAENLRCYGCLANGLPTETISGIGDRCTMNNQADTAFRGQSGVMILSKHPLEDKEAWVLPGTWNRRIIVSARTEKEGQSVDIHCNHLTPIFDGLQYPYTGRYGNGQSGKAAWIAEQRLQIEKLANRVESYSGERAAFILGASHRSSRWVLQMYVPCSQPSRSAYSS
jgi:exonuclease III